MDIIHFDKIEDYESTSWKQKMKESGKAMADNGVRQTIFVHGTFVGGDPIGILGIMKSFGISSRITDLLEKTGKTFNDLIVKDLGNFTEEYITSYSESINNNIDCRRFNWSSENNHIGRLLSLPNLVKDLAEKIDSINELSESDRILLIGHSHAGQIFALLTVFLEKNDKAKSLLNVLIDTDGFDEDQFNAHLEKISTVYLDIVTLGTPVRYRWGNYNKYRLLNIVNHRSDSKIDGVLTTRDGDYVQQWGTDGKDLPPPPSKEKLIAKNNKLDKFLDKGVSKPSSTLTFIYKLLTKRAESTRRQALKENGENSGTSIFIDYKDNEDDPDPIDTLFGHGVYTRTNSMLFNTNIIVEFFYDESKNGTA